IASYDFVEFDVSNIDTNTADTNWNFKVYEFELGTSANDMVVGTDTPLVADVPVIIDGKRPHVFVHIELRREGEEVSNFLYGHSAFSFLAGQYLGGDDEKADMIYRPRPNGNGFEMTVNPKLPNGEMSHRFLASVFIDGNDMKEKFTNLITKPDSLSLSNIVSSNHIQPIPGQTYLYFGPGIETMKDTGRDRVIAVIGVTHVGDDNFGFVYLLKNIQGDENTLDFQGLSINNNFGFQAVEDHYGHTVRIEGFLPLTIGTNIVDMNISGDPEALKSLSPSVVTTPELMINVNTLGKSYSVSWTSEVSYVYRLPNHVDAYSLPSAINSASLTSSNILSTINEFNGPESFVLLHVNGNHSLVNVFSDFSQVDASGEAQGFAMDFLYLMDQIAATRYNVFFDHNNLAVIEKDDFELQVHDVKLDFNLTGREYVEITDVNKARLTIESDRQSGEFRVFPAEGIDPEVLRGTKVFAKFSLGDLVTSFKIDRFDGSGEFDVDKAQAIQGIELGSLDFGAFMNGRILFAFPGEDLSRFRGQEIRLTELSWTLPGSSTTLKTTDFNVTFEFNDQPPVPAGEIGSGMKLISAVSVVTTDAGRFLELTFNETLADEVYQYPYLLNVKRFIEYDPANFGDNNTDPAGTMAQVPMDIQPIELHAQGNKIRAYFSSTDEQVVFDPAGSYELYIGHDFEDFRPTGIKSNTGELLPESWMRYGNVELFNFNLDGINNFFPVVDGNGYVYDIGGQFGDEAFESNQVATTLTKTADSFFISADTSANSSNAIRHFENVNGVFSYCEKGEPQ
ncbi:hypothetical protein MJH12_08510, partial [bacterium]|nr:hypothetical protein [bacterium]